MEKLDHCLKSILTCSRIRCVRKSCYRLEEERLGDGFWCLFVAFLKIGTTFPFFQSSGNIPHFKQPFNILKRGSIIARPDIFTMRILIISWPWTLLGSSSQIILLILPFVDSMFARYWSVMGLVDESSTVKWGY